MRLSDVAYHEIKNMLMKGVFEGTGYTTQSELVKKLEMSRTPIVAALQRLETEGFIKNQANKGIIIQELSIKEINELFDMRIALETFSVKNMSVPPDSEKIKELTETIDNQLKYDKEKDFYNFALADAMFHQQILELNPNSAIIEASQNIGDRLFFHRTLVGKSVNLNNYVNDHIEIVENIKAGKFELAAEILENHIKSGKIYFSN